MLAVVTIAGSAFLVISLIASQSTLRVNSCGKRFALDFKRG
jgi:hypothetical protein